MRRLKTAVVLLCCSLPAVAGSEPLPGLLATGPDPARAVELSLFTPLLGHWEFSYRFHDVGGRVTEQGTGTWDFSWILQGRSLQDVLLFRSADGRLSEFGTTLRIPLGNGLWKSVWDGPVRGNICVLDTRAGAGGILMDGQCNADSAPVRWMFQGIGAKSFEWRGYTSPDQGKHWVLEEEISGKRAATSGRNSAGGI